MSNIQDLTSGEIDAILSNFRHVQCKLNEASGTAVAVEVRMRLIGQLSEEVRNSLTEIVAKSPKKRKSSDYIDCDLEFLDKAIDQVFSKNLDASRCKQIAEFRPLRNKLLHGNFVGLMNLMKIVPTSRQITSASGDRSILEIRDIKEATLSIDRNGGFEKMRQQAENVIIILDEIIVRLAGDRS